MSTNLTNIEVEPQQAGSTQMAFTGTGPVNDYTLSAHELWALIEPLAQAVWETDANGEVVIDSPSWRTYTGQTVDEWLGEGWASAVHPVDRTYALDQWREAVSRRTPVNAEFRVSTPDGDWQWTNIRAMPVYQPDGSVGKWIGINLNIHDRKRAQEDQRKSQESLTAAAIGTYVWYVEEDRGEPDAQMLALFGLPPGGKLNLAAALSSIIHPDDAPRYAEAVAQATDPTGNGQLQQDIRVIHPDGQERWLTVRGKAYFKDTPLRADRLIGSAVDITDRKIAEKNLRESEERFRLMADAVPQIVWLTDAEGRNEFFNKQWYHYTGAPHKSMSADEVTVRFVHPDDRPRTLEAFGQARRTGGSYNVEHRIRSTEGEYRWFLVRGEPYRDTQTGEISRWFGMSVDIHDLKMAEEALHRSEARQRFLLRLGDRLRSLANPIEIQYQAACALGEYLGANRVGYAEDQGDGRTIELTRNYTHGVPGIEGLYRYDEYGPTFMADLQAGRTVVRNDIANDPTLTDAEKAAHKTLQLGATVNKPLVKDGRLVAVLFLHWNQAHTFSDEELALLEETAERTWAAVERARAEERLRQAMSISTVGVIFFDLDGGIHGANEAFGRMSGYAPEDFISGRVRWTELTPPEFIPITLRSRDELLAKGQNTPYQKQYIRPDGSRWWGLFAGKRLSEHECVEFVLDTTELVEARQQIEENEARYRQLSTDLEVQVQQRTQQLQASVGDLLRSNQNLEQFAYVASHDLQEPLRKIQSFGDILKVQYGDALGEGVGYLERMQTAASRMSVLIKDLLSYSRISTVQDSSAPVSLTGVVNAVLTDLDLIVQETGARVEVEPLPTVPGDPSQLSQLFQNLLSNALKFRRPGVTPIIVVQSRSVAADELPPAIIPVRKTAHYYRIEVVDNGIGFDDKYVDRIFQVFQRLHGRNEFAGTGIGLAICEKVVTNHGGAITAVSQPGQGATFSVYLPM